MSDKSLIVRPAGRVYSPEGTVQGHARWMANPEVAGLNEPFQEPFQVTTQYYGGAAVTSKAPLCSHYSPFGLFVC